MNKLLTLIFAVTFIIGFSGSVVFAGNGIDINGTHYNVNIIGKKKGAINGDYSSGASIFIPLKNVLSRDGMVWMLTEQPPGGLMAIERGKLQDLLFDNRVLWSHRALAGVLGAILRLPPVKRALAREQVQSRYLDALVRRYG